MYKIMRNNFWYQNIILHLILHSQTNILCCESMRQQVCARMITFSLAYAWERSHSPGAQSSSGCGRAPLGKPEGGSASHSDSRIAWHWAPLKELQLWGYIHPWSTQMSSQKLSSPKVTVPQLQLCIPLTSRTKVSQPLKAHWLSEIQTVERFD